MIFIINIIKILLQARFLELLNKADLLKEHSFSACAEFTAFSHAVGLTDDKSLFLQKFKHVS